MSDLLFSSESFPRRIKSVKTVDEGEIPEQNYFIQKYVDIFHVALVK